MISKDKERIAITIQKETLEKVKQWQKNFPIKITLSQAIELLVKSYFERKKEQS